MTSAMKYPMQMESSGTLKDALGTIPIIRIINFTFECRDVGLPSVFSMVEHMDHATVSSFILFAKRLVMNERTM